MREDPFHDELRRGGGREGEGAPGRGGGGDPADDGPVVELARGVLRNGAGRERGRRRRWRRGRERVPRRGPGAGEELERVEVAQLNTAAPGLGAATNEHRDWERLRHRRAYSMGTGNDEDG